MKKWFEKKCCMDREFAMFLVWEVLSNVFSVCHSIQIYNEFLILKNLKNDFHHQGNEAIGIENRVTAHPVLGGLILEFNPGQRAPALSFVPPYVDLNFIRTTAAVHIWLGPRVGQRNVMHLHCIPTRPPYSRPQHWGQKGLALKD